MDVRHARGREVDKTENHAQCSGGDTKRAKSDAEPLERREAFLRCCFHNVYIRRDARSRLTY